MPMVICEPDARHTFRVYMPEAASVELVGTFTDWRTRPVRMTREHTGWWTATLAPNALPQNKRVLRPNRQNQAE